MPNSEQELGRLWEKMRRRDIAKEDRAKYVPLEKNFKDLFSILGMLSLICGFFLLMFFYIIQGW